MSVGALLVVGGAVVLLLTDGLLRLAWSFTAGIGPRSNKLAVVVSSVWG